MTMMIEERGLNKDCIVVCPVYKIIESESELFSLVNNRSKLRRYRWTFVGPNVLGNYIKLISRTLGLEDIGFESFDDRYFAGIEGYNRLCKSNEFYARFNMYEYMLVCQLDCLVFGSDLGPWLEARKSFVGAMLYKGYTRGERYLECEYGRNGGLSLRRIQDFLVCLEKRSLVPLEAYREVSLQGASFLYRMKVIASRIVFCMSTGRFQAKINEDVFWTVCMRFVFPLVMTVSDSSSSMLFSMERISMDQARELVNNSSSIPFGCHAWERYNYELWLTLVVKHGLVDARSQKYFEIDTSGIRLRKGREDLLSLLASGNIDEDWK